MDGARRRPLGGAAVAWEAAEAIGAAGELLGQRFRPPRPERRPCKRFLAGACPFGDACSHSHEEPPGLLPGAPGPAAGPGPGPPRVALQKMEDRKVGRGAVSLLLRTLATGGFSPEPARPEEADLLLANAFPAPPLRAKLRAGCVVNHFPGEEELGAKDRLARLVRGLGLCPATYVLPEEAAALEGEAAASAAGRLWIVKPCQQGEGRHVAVLRGQDGLRDAGALSRRCVVSEYLAEPLLIGGRKVDLRVYVLVTSIEPHLEASIFRDGLVRFCGEEYDVSEGGLQRVGGHVSNNAVQSKAQRHAAALNWSLPQLWSFLASSGGPGATAVWRRIHRLVRDTLEAWWPDARAAASRSRAAGGGALRCYSLLALDLLLDRRGAVWLLEVNPKPALHAQSASLKAVFPVHFAVKSALLADLFSLVGLPHHAGGPAARQVHPGHLGFELLLPSARNPAVRFTVGIIWHRLVVFLERQWLKQLAAVCPRWAQASGCLAL